MKIVGIDEAGRGSVLGPLVVCGVTIAKNRIRYIERLKLKDSKRITPKKRTVLARKIKKIAECYPISIEAQDIDLKRSQNINLNQIEKNAIYEIIRQSKPELSIIDCLDVNPDRFKQDVEDACPSVKVLTEHKAEDKYPLVAAASIVAKVERDLSLERIRKEYSGIGSGYPSDPQTISFLKEWEYSDLPPFVRKSWSTVEKNCKK